MARVAELTKKTRDETFIERLSDSRLVNMTPAIFSLGQAPDGSDQTRRMAAIRPTTRKGSGTSACSRNET